MVILSIDPGTYKLGWALTDEKTLIDAGLIESQKKKLGDRFLQVYKALGQIFDRAATYELSLVAVEQYVGASKLGTDAMKGLIGIIHLMAAQRGYPVIDFYPTTVKKMLTGDGKADKEVVAQAVARQYPTGYNASLLDVTDAIALGIAIHEQLKSDDAFLETFRRAVIEAGGGINYPIVRQSLPKITKSEYTQGLARMRQLYEHEQRGGKYLFDIPLRLKEITY